MLSDILRRSLSLTIPSKNNCRNPNHCAPFDFVADALIAPGLRKAVVWANRSGGKSYNLGLITWLRSLLQEKCGTKILGGSSDQSRKVYEAFVSFFNISEMQNELLIKEPTQLKTEYRNESNVSILTASMNSVRGGHQSALILDEVEEMHPDIFEAALSQPQSLHGINASVLIGSTYHRVAGVMNHILNGKIGATSKIFNWCLWEVIESCRDYSCSTCKLKPYCPGTHMKEADGYYKIEDFVDKLETLSLPTINAEWFCKEPSREGLVFKVFEEKLYPAGHLVDVAPDASRPFYIGMDFGSTKQHPYIVLIIQAIDNPKGWCIVDQYAAVGKTTPSIIEENKKAVWFRESTSAFADPSRPDLIELWNEAGLSTQEAPGEIEEGNDKVVNLMKPAIGAPKLFVSTRCQNVRIEDAQYGILHELNNYAYSAKTGKPVDKDNHCVEAIRRFCNGMGEDLMDIIDAGHAASSGDDSIEVNTAGSVAGNDRPTMGQDW